jgi:transcriptional/translational regulatory protein YebC/TACO1
VNVPIKVESKLKQLGMVVEEKGIIMKPRSPIKLTSETEVEDILDLVDNLEENDDVIKVFAGFDYDE